MVDGPFEDNLDDEEDDDEDPEGLANFTCVGTHFRDSQEKAAFNALEPGDPVKLVPEPDNQYDGNAIKIMGRDPLDDESNDFCLHLGYVPRTENEYIGELLQQYPGAVASNLYSNVFVLQKNEEEE